MVESYLHADVVRDEVPVRVYLVFKPNLSLQRVENDLEGV